MSPRHPLFSLLLLSACGISSAADAASPALPAPPALNDPCVEPGQARLNLALFDAVARADGARVIAALGDGANPNCAYPTLHAQDGSYQITAAYDVPLYRATKLTAQPSTASEIFNLLVNAGAQPATQTDTPEQQLAVSSAYLPFYASPAGQPDFEGRKATTVTAEAVEPAADAAPGPAPIQDLTVAEIQAATVDPTATDAWSKLAAQAPLESFAIGGDHMKAILGYATSLSEWNDRAARIRAEILSNAQLDPLPPKTPLHPIINQLKTRGTYSIQNVAFEATPGFFVTGNLFTPSGTGPFPAILLSHGHFGPWGKYARTLPENQILATRLVQMGAVVFTYDMVGWGDAQQLDHADSYGFWGFGDEDHFKDGTKNNILELELWNGIRSLDFLTSLTDANGKPLVDASRIGVTGASGGATHSLYLAAVDPRVSAAALVVMINAAYTGDDHCEDGMPVHTVPGERKTVNTEIAATFAPKPMLIISDGNDWTRWFYHDEYPYLKRVWGFFNTATSPNFDNQVVNFNFPTEQHDYQHNKRAAAYQFFSAAFGLPVLANTGTGPVTDDNPEGVTLEDRGSLEVFTTQFPKPDYPMTHLLKRN